MTLKVYLAGPDVFLPNAIEMGEKKKALCVTYGFEGLFPFDNEITESDERIDRLIYKANVEMIKRADLGIFNLTPFRGPSADVGTVFELGMMVGLGKPVFGYTHDFADLLMRTRALPGCQYHQEPNKWYDGYGMLIEDFGNADNLMIDGSLGDHLVRMVTWSTITGRQFRNLDGFEECLQLARRELLNESV
jgi:nucleoside 2-deoxyribosyltransferase